MVHSPNSTDYLWQGFGVKFKTYVSLCGMDLKGTSNITKTTFKFHTDRVSYARIRRGKSGNFYV